MKQKSKTSIFLMVFGAVCILLMAFAITLIFTGIKKDSGELLLEKNKLKSFSEGMAGLQESRAFYEAHVAEFEKINAQFIDSEVPVEFIKFLEKIAADSRLLIDISPAMAEKKENDGQSGISFNVSADGSFPDVLKFLEKLENSPYLIKVINLNMARITDEKVPVGSVNALFLLKVATK